MKRADRQVASRFQCAKVQQATVKERTKDGKKKTATVRYLKSYVFREIYNQLCFEKTVQLAA